MIDEAAANSREHFASGFYCAESVLLAMAESQDIQSRWIPGIATGFCSGLSGSGGMCGAVSGAVMGIGLITGRSTPQQSTAENYAHVRELLKRFEEKFGSTYCVELIGCDLGTEEGRDGYRANQLVELCKRYVEEATRIVLTVVAARAPAGPA